MYEKRGKVMGRPKLVATKEAHVFSYKTKSNQKRYAYRYRHTRVDNTRKEFYKQGFIALKDATLALTELKAELLKGNYEQVDHRHLTLAQAFEMFIEYRQGNVKPNTIRLTNTVFNRMNPLIGNITLKNLTPYLYKREFLNKLDHLKLTTLATYHDRICAVLNFAVKNDFLDKNRLMNMSINYDVTHTIIEKHELTQIMEYTKSKKTYLYPLILFLASTGTRIGEALGLKWRDLDFDKGVIDINCTVSNSYGEGPPKTKNSYRVIPLPPKMIEELKKYKQQQKKKLLQSGMAAEQLNFEKRYIFRNLSNRPLRYSSVKNYFKGAREHLKIVHLTPHVFRHTYASILISEGVDMATVASLMGDTIGTIQKIYVHAINEKREEAILYVEKMLISK